MTHSFTNSSASTTKSARILDRVFGALGIAPAEIAGKITSDYTPPVEKVYKQACIVYITEVCRLDLLSRCDLATRQIPGPTWMPDWEAILDSGILEFLTLCHASGDAAAAGIVRGDIRSAQGVECGCTDFVSERVSKGVEDIVPALAHWQSVVSENKNPSSTTSESVSNNFVRLLFSDSLRERYGLQFYPCFSEAKEILQNLVLKNDTSEQKCSDQLDSPLPRLFSDLLDLDGRRFFTTSSGQLGVTGADAVPVILCASCLVARYQYSSAGNQTINLKLWAAATFKV